MKTAELRQHGSPSTRDLERWQRLLEDFESGALANPPAIAACAELLGAVPRLIDDVRRLRAGGQELLNNYEQAELDGIANHPLAPNESELLGSEVAHYRELFGGR